VTGKTLKTCDSCGRKSASGITGSVDGTEYQPVETQRLKEEQSADALHAMKANL